MPTVISASDILKFWFEELSPKQQFAKSDSLDEQMHARFRNIHGQASRCELYSWRISARGRLAEIIVLDQFSRNIYRDQALSFAADPLALALAQEAIAHGSDQELEVRERTFLYMPFMHSESLIIHDRALELFKVPGLEDNFEFEKKHQAIIKRFGRFPHRNAILGRTSTAEEIDFLKQPGSHF